MLNVTKLTTQSNTFKTQHNYYHITKSLNGVNLSHLRLPCDEGTPVSCIHSGVLYIIFSIFDGDCLDGY
jgi:hypothetical protein